MNINQYHYIYSFTYDYHHSDLCKLESRQIFGIEEKNNTLFSNIKVDTSLSAFIKFRFEIITSADNFDELLPKVKVLNIKIDGFKAEYLILNGDTIDYNERRKKLKNIGYSIEGEPDFKNPSIIYSICNYNNVWYFGILEKQNVEWHKHNNKPISFSNSIDMNIGKTLVSIATRANKSTQLLDACCGVGTIMLEACFAGFNIEGCEISYKACNNANINLEHYSYNSYVHYCDIKDVKKKYDAVIIDLPYNLYSYSNDNITLNILTSSAKISDRLVIVSIANIKQIIEELGLIITDFCTVEKRGKSNFSRSIWVCQKESKID